MAGPIVPVARAVYLCDLQVGYSGGKSDLYGIFNSIRSPAGYPYVHPEFCVYAELGSGLGQVSCWVDILEAGTGQLARTTNVYQLTFPNRDMVFQLAIGVQGCSFPHPGIYHVELFCENQWVADTTLRLL